MHLIVITRPDFFPEEVPLVCRLFEAGLERLHLRKPDASRETLAAWLDAVPQQWRCRIVLHDHHDLALQYGLGGIHLNRRHTTVPDAMDPKHFTLSRSCHSLQEIRQHKAACDYLLLSPIFDSISKQGYAAAFSPEELAEAKQEGLLYNNVYALGGVSFERLREVKEMGFGGAAMLGAVWDDPDGAILQLRAWATRSGR